MFGLIGNPLGHSYSVPIHAAFDNPSYRLIPLEEEALAGFLARPEVTGLNVTIPYKRAVIPFCSRLDANASAIGSVLSPSGPRRIACSARPGAETGIWQELPLVQSRPAFTGCALSPCTLVILPFSTCSTTPQPTPQ